MDCKVGDFVCTRIIAFYNITSDKRLLSVRQSRKEFPNYFLFLLKNTFLYDRKKGDLNKYDSGKKILNNNLLINEAEKTSILNFSGLMG